MFNQNSTSGERRAFLEALLENDKDDEEVSAISTRMKYMYTMHIPYNIY